MTGRRRQGARWRGGSGKETVRERGSEDRLLQIMYFNVHQRFLGPHYPPINSTSLFTDTPCTKSSFPYNCVKHHLPALWTLTSLDEVNVVPGSGSTGNPVIQANSSDSLTGGKGSQLLGLLTPGSTATLSLLWSANTPGSVLVPLKITICREGLAKQFLKWWGWKSGKRHYGLFLPFKQK